MEVQEVIAVAKLQPRINAELWKILNPKTEEEEIYYYQVNRFYSFGLALWHMRRGQRKFRRKVVSKAKGKVLDYGAGIGDLCIELAKKMIFP